MQYLTTAYLVDLVVLCMVGHEPFEVGSKKDLLSIIPDKQIPPYLTENIAINHRGTVLLSQPIEHRIARKHLVPCAVILVQERRHGCAADSAAPID